MTTLDTPTSLGATGLRQRRPAAEGEGSPLDALRPPVHDGDVGRADHHARRGPPHLRRRGPEVLRRPLGPVRRQRRPRARPPRRGRRQAGRAARVLPDLVVCAPGGHRARRPPGRLRARRPQPRVLLHRRRRGGRDGVQAREVLLEAQGPADQAQGDLARGRLPRHAPGRPGDHRHPGDEGDVRAAHARWIPRAEHELLSRGRGRRAGRRPRGLRHLGGEPHRGDDPVRGSRDGRRGVPRAGAELGRLLPAAPRLLPARAGDLRPVRRAARLRRGDLRVRPHRAHVRVRRVRLRARHDHLRQGDDLGLLPDRRHDRVGEDLRAVRHGQHVVLPRVHLRRAPGVGRGRAREPRHLRGGGAERARPA